VLGDQESLLDSTSGLGNRLYSVSWDNDPQSENAAEIVVLIGRELSENNIENNFFLL
jgi:hypothetical protein